MFEMALSMLLSADWSAMGLQGSKTSIALPSAIIVQFALNFSCIYNVYVSRTYTYTPFRYKQAHFHTYPLASTVLGGRQAHMRMKVCRWVTSSMTLYETSQKVEVSFGSPKNRD